jgi:dTDP-4-amino-4,6-dideoxygalactose transaminase
MSFQAVEQFEKTIAKFYNAPYAVAVDCCTHGIELCLLLTEANEISCPTNTYISVPFTFKKLGLTWNFRKEQWSDYYYIGNTNIIDAAVYFKQDGYIPDSLMVLSFQFKKPLGLGRGGAILCNTADQYVALKKMSYDGRYGDKPWANQDIDTMGYHYYMTPETAQQGIEKLPVVAQQEWPQWSWLDYPDLTNMAVFNEK